MEFNHKPFPKLVPVPNAVNDAPMPQDLQPGFQGPFSHYPPIDRLPPNDKFNKNKHPKENSNIRTDGSNREITTSANNDQNSASIVDFVDPDSEVMDTLEPVAITFTSAAVEPSQYIYKVPDGMENDPELLRAELLFYNTPETQNFSEQVYSNLKSIQNQCAADYTKFCSNSLDGMSDFQDFFDQLMLDNLFSGRRRRLEAKEAARSVGRQLLENIKSFLTKPFNNNKQEHGTRPALPIVQQKRVALKQSQDGAAVIHNVIQPHNSLRHHNHHDSTNDKRALLGMGKPMFIPPTAHHGPEHAKPFKAHKADHKHHSHSSDSSEEQPNHKKHDSTDSSEEQPHGKSDFHHPHDHHHHRDDDGEEDDDHHRPEHGVPPPPPPPPLPEFEDNSFPGALGFGAQGDLCIYQNVPQLSTPCLNAIGDLYELRENYWNDHVQTTSSYHHHHPHGIFFLLGALLLLLIGCRRRKVVRDLLVGLEANPELKAQVEAQLGVKVPSPPCCARACGGGSCLKKTLMYVGVFVGTFLISFPIALSSVVISQLIVDSIDRHSEADVSAPFASFILFSVCLLHVAAFSLLVRKVKACYMRNQSVPSAPAAPVSPENKHSKFNGVGGFKNVTPIVMHSTATPATVTSSTAVSGGSWPQWLVLPQWTTRPTMANATAYQPLLQEDTEMVAVGTTNQQRVAFVSNGMPVTTTTMPITARPVTTVSFV